MLGGVNFPPTPDDVRALVAELDDRDRKVVGGLVTLMIAEPTRVRDHDWLAERFVHVAVLAHESPVDEERATTEDVETVQAYAKARMPSILNTAFALFFRTAEELKLLGESYTIDDARNIIATYLTGS